MSSALIPFAVYGFVRFCIDLRTAYLSTKPVGALPLRHATGGE